MSQNINVSVEIAPGELIDKITILQIKRVRITDGDKVANVIKELGSLEDSLQDSLVGVILT